MKDERPLVALTMGDVAGIGPEVIAKAWSESPLRTLARPFVIGSRAILKRAIDCVSGTAQIQMIDRPEDAEPNARTIPCMEATDQDLQSIAPGRVDPRSGRAAYEFLTVALELALEGRIDAITTLPLNKECLRGRESDIRATRRFSPNGAGWSTTR